MSATYESNSGSRECPSSAESLHVENLIAESGHADSPSMAPLPPCPAMRTAVLSRGLKVKGVRVTCKAKGCPVCGPIEWSLHMEPVRKSAEAGEMLYFIEVSADAREAFHKRVRRAGAEAKYVPVRHGAFLCVTTYACGVEVDFCELEDLMLAAFERSARLGANVTGTRGWKKANELVNTDGSVVVRRSKKSGWAFEGYAGMSPAKAQAAAEGAVELVPRSMFIAEPHGWTTSCVDESVVARVLIAVRVLDPAVVVRRKLDRQASNEARGRSLVAA